ncbi:PadR family transcriptional regulator [Nonomuraea sp. B12E4]|uniref:PadR family transcriptional regulator n=1 Tax=Nonomuraea sp. B12E4 TaxID=3153564 RepID=UPI00325DC1EC
MSLRYALLGLLAQQAASGYDLAKAFEGPLGRYAWQAGHNRIYPELARLAEEGLIEVVAEGARGRRSYALTAMGHAEFDSWMTTPQQRHAVRNELVLRLFLLPALEANDARKLLRELAGSSAREADDIREMMASDPLDPSQGKVPFGWLAAGFGLRNFEMVRDWALWALAELDKVEHHTGADATGP